MEVEYRAWIRKHVAPGKRESYASVALEHPEVMRRLIALHAEQAAHVREIKRLDHVIAGERLQFPVSVHADTHYLAAQDVQECRVTWSMDHLQLRHPIPPTRYPGESYEAVAPTLLRMFEDNVAPRLRDQFIQTLRAAWFGK